MLTIITLARKPLRERSLPANLQKHGCGALDIDRSRIGDNPEAPRGALGAYGVGARQAADEVVTVQGRWPANLILAQCGGCQTSSCEPTCVVAEMDRQGEAVGIHSAGVARSATRKAGKTGLFPMDGDGHRFGDTGGASRFFKVIEEGGK